MENAQSLSDNQKLLHGLFGKHVVSAGLSMFGVQCCLMVNSMLAGIFFGGAGLVVMSVVSPLYSVYAAIGALCGIGGSIITAHELGRDDKDSANETFSCAFFTCLAISAAVSIVGLIFQENLLYLLGSTEQHFQAAQAYSTIYIFGGVFTALFYMPYHFLKLTGQLQYLIWLFIAMAIENALLDWLFCAALKFGVEGIALGTVASSLITVVVGFRILLRGKDNFRLVRKINPQHLRELFRFGTPSALNQVLNFLRFVLMNQLLLLVAGQMGLAVFSVVKAIENFSTIIMSGISQATSGFVGVFFVERDFTSIRQIEQQAHALSLKLIVPLVIVLWLFADQICLLFGVGNFADTSANWHLSNGIRLFSLSLIPSAFCLILTSYYQSTKYTRLANLITTLRGFVFLLIPAYFLATQFGSQYVWHAFTIASVATLAVLGAVLYFNRSEDKSPMLLLDLHDEKAGKSIAFTVKANVAAITESVENIAAFCAKNNLTAKETMFVRLSMEELMIGIAEHCFKDDAEATIDVRIFIVQNGDKRTIVLRLRTGGKLFNPIEYYKQLEKKDPLEFAMSDALGISMIAKAAKSIRYKSTFGINNLTIRIERKERIMSSINFKNAAGKEITVNFRRFQPRDASAIVNLIRDEYGGTYRKRAMYDTNYIVQQCAEKNLFLYVAELPDGKIIGTLGVKRDLPDDTSCSIVTGIILKPYRRFGIFFPMIKYVAAKIRKLENVSAIQCHSLMYHDITQKLVYKVGLKPCGFIPSVTIVENFRHSFSKVANPKLTLGILIRRKSKRDVGKIYLPVEHSVIAREIYSALRLKVQISNDAGNLRGATELICTNDERQQACTIEILSAGEDLAEAIRAIHAKYNGALQTFNVFLNISDAKSIAAYDELKKLGYFFAGLQPACKRHEIMILHNPRRVAIDFDTLTIIPAFEPLKDYVKNCYESRCRIED